MLQRLALVAIPLLTLASSADEAITTCALTPLLHATKDDAPAEARLGGWWHTNADRSLWMMAVPLAAGPGGYKVPWFRPRGTHLEVTGRRLDADAERARISVPCCYGGRFQITAMTFPSEGCWEISATAGASTLVLVTLVQPPPTRNDDAR
jgi:hypothetical protein